MILVDSDILIQFSRHDDIAADWLDRSSDSARLAVSVITQMELVFGSRDKRHLAELQKFLVSFEILQIHEAISRRASSLIERYCLSHRLEVPDALIAATALEIGCDLATINLRDFRYIDGLRIVDYP